MTQEKASRPFIARQGWNYSIGLFALGVLAALWGGWLWTVLFFLLSCGVAAFFRDPERTPPDVPDVVVAPADGRVVAVDRMGEERHAVRIFLSLFDVHINRTPVAGTVRETEYRQGNFLAAFREEASHVNEQNILDIQSEGGEIFRMAQIAGVIARRISCWVKKGDQLRRGERIGLIHFGSRTDLFLPPGYDVMVEVGSKVRGGETIVARKHQE